MGAINLSVVAQIANLLYGRLQIGRTLAEFTASGQSAVLQDGILRYSRLAVCATNTTEALNRYQAHGYYRGLAPRAEKKMCNLQAPGFSPV